MLLLSTWHLTFAILFYATIDVLALESFVTFIFVLKAVFFLKKIIPIWLSSDNTVPQNILDS